MMSNETIKNRMRKFLKEYKYNGYGEGYEIGCIKFSGVHKNEDSVNIDRIIITFEDIEFNAGSFKTAFYEFCDSNNIEFGSLLLDI